MRKLILAGLLMIVIIFSFFAMKSGMTFPRSEERRVGKEC